MTNLNLKRILGRTIIHSVRKTLPQGFIGSGPTHRETRRNSSKKEFQQEFQLFVALVAEIVNYCPLFQ
jgi:hypothetical protein